MNKTLKYIVLLAIACFVSKGYAQELKSEVFSLLNLDYPGLEKVKTLHQEGKDDPSNSWRTNSCLCSAPY